LGLEDDARNCDPPQLVVENAKRSYLGPYRPVRRCRLAWD
jgi:hypothetical protein